MMIVAAGIGAVSLTYFFKQSKNKTLNAEKQFSVVNSFQGAFGPPTQGHFEAMLFSGRQTLLDYKGERILMLFMPTAESRDKAHLKLTQKERIAALNELCDKLKNSISEDDRERIEFRSSEIEYDLFPEKKSTSTIFTIEKLRELYPNAKLVLTLGLDNFLDLPFWKEVERYPDFVKTCYVLSRDLIAEDLLRTKTVVLNGSELRFNKYASWDSKESSSLELKLEFKNARCGAPLLKTLEQITYRTLEKPSPTSSSLLRCALQKYYGDGKQPGQDKYLPAIKILAGRELPALRDAAPANKEADPWYRCWAKCVLCDPPVLEKTEKMMSFDYDFSNLFPSKL